MRDTRRRERRHGQVIVEFALLFPFFILVILGGIIDFGFAFFNLVSVEQLASLGAQFAAEGKGTTGASDEAVRTLILSRKPSSWAAERVTIGVSSIEDKKTGRPVVYKQVTVTFQSPLYTPFYMILGGMALGQASIPVSSQAVFQIPTQR